MGHSTITPTLTVDKTLTLTHSKCPIWEVFFRIDTVLNYSIKEAQSF